MDPDTSEKAGLAIFVDVSDLEDSSAKLGEEGGLETREDDDV